MKTEQVRKLALVGGAVLLLAGGIAAPKLILGDLELFSWKPALPGAVLSERMSPDSQLIASVVGGDSAGRYTFSLRSTRTGVVIARHQLVAPVGYHAHRVQLEWSRDGSRAIATIDHDFGEKNVQDSLLRP